MHAFISIVFMTFFVPIIYSEILNTSTYYSFKVCQWHIYTHAHLGLCPGKICECLGKTHAVKKQLEYLYTSTTQRKQ